MGDTGCAAVDPLGEALHFLRMSSTFYCSSEFTAPWGLALPPMRKRLMFHVVVSGRCWIEDDEVPLRVLEPGDLTLVPHGEGHRLVSEPGQPAVPLFDLPREYANDRYEILRHGGDGAATSIVCGAVRFDDPAARQLLALLPRMISHRVSSASQLEWIHSTLRLMAAEARTSRPGAETIVTRLADILVIQAIRAWIEQDPAAQTGWLGALHDRQIGRAIALIHRQPAREWTVASLASEVAMSRSAFAARFTALVGEPAMRYVTRWRMYAARTRLKDENVSVADVASGLGYESEAAFSRAFKRHMGVSPGTLRLARGFAKAKPPARSGRTVAQSVPAIAHREHL